MTSAKRQRQIAHYLRKRLEYLETCSVEFEDRISKDQAALANSDADQATIGQLFFRLEYVLGNTFRYSLLIGVCSYLEEALRTICELVIADHDSQLHAVRGKHWLAAHRKLLENDAVVSFETVEDEYCLMDDMVVVRNCLVHAWGRMSKCKNRQRLDQIVSRRPFLQVSMDGYLVITDEGVPSAVDASGEIVNHVLQSGLGVSIF